MATIPKIPTIPIPVQPVQTTLVPPLSPLASTLTQPTPPLRSVQLPPSSPPTVQLSIFNTHTFVFVAVCFLTICIVCFYLSVKPEDKMPFYFQPFPSLSPSMLPDPHRNIDTCATKLTSCNNDYNGQCSACTTGNTQVSDFQCVTVSADEASRKYYHFNGINVPEGKWCLPKAKDEDKLNRMTCNSVTGRWIWTYDPEYCSKVSSSTQQCWKCMCVYPELFSGEESGCNINVACKNTSINATALPSEQNQNYLRGTSTGPFSECIYDPTNPTELTGKCQGMYRYTPYDKDENGNPLFECHCGSTEKDLQKFKRLPNDPYTCHLSPCLKYKNYQGDALYCNDNTDNCSCTCDTNMAISPSGKYKDTCVMINQSCGNGYGFRDGKCTCNGEGGYWERQCRSPVTGVNMDKPNLPVCQKPQNALGSECFNPCQNKGCLFGAKCIACGPDAYKSNPKCGVDADGFKLANPREIHSYCDCETIDKNNLGKLGGRFGEKCAMTCLEGGRHIKKDTFGVTQGGSEYTCGCCCSQKYHYVEDAWVFKGHWECDSGRPDYNNPADGRCSKRQCKNEDGDI